MLRGRAVHRRSLSPPSASLQCAPVSARRVRLGDDVEGPAVDGAAGGAGRAGLTATAAPLEGCKTADSTRCTSQSQPRRDAAALPHRVQSTASAESSFEGCGGAVRGGGISGSSTLLCRRRSGGADFRGLRWCDGAPSRWWQHRATPRRAAGSSPVPGWVGAPPPIQRSLRARELHGKSLQRAIHPTLQRTADFSQPVGPTSQPDPVHILRSLLAHARRARTPRPLAPLHPTPPPTACCSPARAQRAPAGGGMDCCPP